MSKKLIFVLSAVALALVAAGTTLVLLLPSPTKSGPPLDGCTKGETQEMYAVERYNCADGTAIVTFNNNDGRDQYRQIAETFGQQTVDVGDNWLRVRT